MWDLLLSAAIDASFGIIAAAGFEDELKQLTQRWTKADDRAKQHAFDEAVKRAFAAMGSADEQEKVRSLVEQRHIRDEMIAGLMDPMTGFDVSKLADAMGERFRFQSRALRNFFIHLENALLQDDLWGPTLERFQELRFRDDVLTALQEQKSDVPARQMVQELGTRLEGSGAIAQGDNSVAAGEGAIAVGGNWEQVVNIVNVYVQNVLGNDRSGLPSNATLHQRYLAHVAKQTGILRGLDHASADPNSHVQMKLADVYINLNTTTQVRDDDEPGKGHRRSQNAEQESELFRDDENARTLPVLEAFIGESHMVLLGGPGSGKSTFVNHLTFCLASHGMNGEAGWLDRLPEWPAERRNLTPLRVVLRSLAAWIEATQPTQNECGLFVDYLAYWLEQNALESYHTSLTEMLHEGQLLILFDGLDEVPVDAELRGRVLALIEAVGETFSDCPILATSRVLSYREDANWQLDIKQWQVFELAPFSEAKIESFIETWYQQLERLGQVADGSDRSQRLLQAVRRPDLWRLAETPLLLTVMAMVHARNNELPDARALLYEEVVDLLLWRWEAVKIQSKDGSETDLRKLLAQADLKEIDLKQLLWQIAFDVHDSVKEAEIEVTADIPESTLLRGLQKLHPSEDLNWADQMIEIIKERAGLLVEDTPGIYSFPHRTFQEYLAACYLSSLGDFGEKGAELAKQGVFWREVLLLAVGRLVHSGDTDKPLVLISHLCASAEAGKSNDATWAQVWRAGDALVEIGVDRAKRKPLGSLMIAQARTHLTTLVSDGHLSPRERTEAGAALGQIGDVRFGVGVDAETGLPQIEWCDVEPAHFIMGLTEDEWIDEADGPQFTCHLVEEPYRISRYPVTVAQYSAFIAAGGYQNESFWTEAGWGWRRSEDVNEPNSYDATYQTPNHPRVGVSWYEAVAYCNWLSEVLEQTIQLPSEAQWELAARHTDGRAYPWGEEFNAERCNMHETGIGSTSAVGLFEAYNAHCGAADMSGNVWEWCSTKWLGTLTDYEKNVDEGLDGTDARALRGGSWYHSHDYVRCAVRGSDGPTVRNNDIGFRLVSPGC